MDDAFNKKNDVKYMFGAISKRYDFLNHFLSLSIDRYWRKKTIALLQQNISKNRSNIKILDVATGTADLAIELLKLNPSKIIGIDISEKMLNIGEKKIKNKSLEQIIQLQLGDAENIYSNDNTFDIVTSAFGVRNFSNLEKGLHEMYRILKPDGKIAVLEFSMPNYFIIKYLYILYFKYILPILGRIISGNKIAYNYLYKTASAFPSGNNFIQILKNTGFLDTNHYPLTFGIVTVYIGTKK